MFKKPNSMPNVLWKWNVACHWVKIENFEQKYGQNVTWHFCLPPPSPLEYLVKLSHTPGPLFPHKSVTYYLNGPYHVELQTKTNTRARDVIKNRHFIRNVDSVSFSFEWQINKVWINLACLFGTTSVDEQKKAVWAFLTWQQIAFFSS